MKKTVCKEIKFHTYLRWKFHCCSNLNSWDVKIGIIDNLTKTNKIFSTYVYVMQHWILNENCRNCILASVARDPIFDGTPCTNPEGFV